MKSDNPHHRDEHLEYYIIPALIVGVLHFVWIAVTMPVRILFAIVWALRDTEEKFNN